MRTVLAMALLLSGVARADTVVLANHESFVGRIVAEKPDAVTISSDGIEWTFKRDRIASVTHDASEADREAAEARRRNEVAVQDSARRKADEDARLAARKRAFEEANARRRQPPATGDAENTARRPPSRRLRPFGTQSPW